LDSFWVRRNYEELLRNFSVMIVRVALEGRKAQPILSSSIQPSEFTWENKYLMATLYLRVPKWFGN
jgi:hypothetical protein